MQAKNAQGVVEALKDAAVTAEASELNSKLDSLLRLAEEQVFLQKISLLEGGQVIRFPHGGTYDIALALPNVQDDYLQRMILKHRGFYEARLLATVQDLGVIDRSVTVCDIGANIGNHSVFFGRVLGAKRVLAFEPQANVYSTLCRNLELNGLTDALAYNCLVGAKSGRGNVVKFNPRNLGATTFAPAKDGQVPMVALDDLIDAEEMQGLGFVKIDAEGMQMDVLQGAKKVLKELRPTLWIELGSRDGGLEAVTKHLSGLGYSPIQIGPNDHIFAAKK